MAGIKSPSSSSPISIGNCKVEIEGNNFICESRRNNLQISVSNTAKIKISVNNAKRFNDIQYPKSGEIMGVVAGSSLQDYLFLLVHPKDIDSRTKSLLQEILTIYMKELPAMNYAANTGKESLFLERCVSNGKYCTLILKSNSVEGFGEVIAAVTYQIIPADTQYAEIPLAAVNSNYQHKGIGRLLYSELRKRLQNVGVRTILCWADKESEGFWLKQGFVSVAEVDTKGRVRKLPIKADIRRALCFPGGSTLMVSHISKDLSIPADPLNQLKLCFPLKPHAKSPSSVPVKVQELVGEGACNDPPDSNSFKEVSGLIQIIPQSESPQPQVLVKDGCTTDDNGSSPRCDFIKNCTDLVPLNGVDCKDTTTGLGVAKSGYEADAKHCSCSGQVAKRKVWEASWSSLKSKKVKGCHRIDCCLDSNWDLVFEHDRRNDFSIDVCSLDTSRDKTLVEDTLKDHPNIGCPAVHVEEIKPVHIKANEDHIREDLPSKGECPTILLMNIADEVKKTHLTKIIEDLGGVVTSDGSVSTHIVTGKVRRTLNLCTALCSGAWIISPSWLKASFREGRFVDEEPFILKDEEYVLRYRTEMKDAVYRGKASPRALLKGYDICLGTHVEPPVDILSSIAKSAGGNVLHGLDEMHEPSTTIYVACEEDMEEALVAAKRGLWTFNSDWFMNCIMRQELDLEAPKFAESL